MTEKAASWRFIEEYPQVSPAIAAAQELAEQWHVTPISNAVGAQLSVTAALVGASTIAEIGTGTGVSGLWLLRGAPAATLTTIEQEVDYQQAAKRSFAKAGIPSHQTRTILGRGLDVMGRLADAAYDIVFIDADADQVNDYVAQALRIARPGGAILVAHVLDGDRVPDPVQRTASTTSYRSLITNIGEAETILSAISANGDGLLTIVKPVE